LPFEAISSIVNNSKGGGCFCLILYKEKRIAKEGTLRNKEGQKVKLYDIEKDEVREVPENESNFRSTKPYKCYVCHTISNEFIIPRNFYGSIHLICPGLSSNKEAHELLWEKIRNGLGPRHPASVIKELEREIKELRLQFQNVASNVVGIENWNSNIDIPVWYLGKVIGRP
jgi:hypothetical protein